MPDSTTPIATAPQYLQDFSRALTGTASALAEQPYQPYDYARIQGLDPLQQQAQTLAQQNVGTWKPNVDYAGSRGYQQVQNYMNPYQQNVVNRIAQLGQRNLTENLLPQVNSTFTGAGQFGSTRNQDFVNRALRDTQEAVLGQQGTLLNTGYNQAMEAFQKDATRAAEAARMGATLGAADVAALSAAGEQNQQLGQQNLNLNYQNFQEQRDYPKRQLEWLNQMVTGAPQSTYMPQTVSSTTQQPAQTMSPLLQAAMAFSGIRSLLSPTQQVANQGY